MQTVFRSVDGKIFEDSTECLKYESKNSVTFLRDSMLKLIDTKCPRTYNDDNNTSYICCDDVLDFIEVCSDEILEFIGELTRLHP